MAAKIESKSFGIIMLLLLSAKKLLQEVIGAMSH